MSGSNDIRNVAPRAGLTVDRLQAERQLTSVEANVAGCRQYIVRQREILVELTRMGADITESPSQ
jgi:hypothetical protein